MELGGGSETEGGRGLAGKKLGMNVTQKEGERERERETLVGGCPFDPCVHSCTG